MKGRKEIVAASELASWHWCPESWRLDAVGMEPENGAAMERGRAHHSRNASFEARSRSLAAFGFRLALAALIVGALAFLCSRL